MERRITPSAATIAIVLLLVVIAGAPTATGATHPQLAGTWHLNRTLSALPREVGLDPDSDDTGGATTGRSSTGGQAGRPQQRGQGGQGRGGGSVRVGSPTPHFESEEDARKIRELVAEVKSPSDRLTISQSDAFVTIADDRDRTRLFHLNGKSETLRLEAGPIGVTTRWENEQLVIRYQVEKDRELRYRLSRDASGRLLVQAQFAERGKGEIITRVYDADEEHRR